MQKLAAAIVAIVGAAQANYLSGEVRSQEWFTYGKFVARMQNPGKMGTVQSFFTYTAQDWPHGWNEIDVELVPSVTDNPFSMNIIWRDGAQDHDYATGFHPGIDWFTYTVEWTPNYVSWYVNDRLVRKTEGTEAVHFLNMPTQLMMNFWTPCWSPWNDYFDDAEMPWYAKYDFVEIYDYDQKTGDFNLRWRDDFNTFDSKKWYASDNWGFENNSSLFMSSQVYVEDGNLVLKMDYNDGHAREFPPHHMMVHHEKPLHEDVHHSVAHHTAKEGKLDAQHYAAPFPDVKLDVPHTPPHALEGEHHVAAMHGVVHPEVHPNIHHATVVTHEAPVLTHHGTVVTPVTTHTEVVTHETVPVHHAAVVAPAHHAAVVTPVVTDTHVIVPTTHHDVEAGHHGTTVVHQDADIHTYEAPIIHHSAYAHEDEYGYPHEVVSHAYAAEAPHAYESVEYGAYPEGGYHGDAYGRQYHVYTAPVSEHHLTEYPTHVVDDRTFAEREQQFVHDTYPHLDQPRYYTDVKEGYYHHPGPHGAEQYYA